MNDIFYRQCGEVVYDQLGDLIGGLSLSRIFRIFKFKLFLFSQMFAVASDILIKIFYKKNKNKTIFVCIATIFLVTSFSTHAFLAEDRTFWKQAHEVGKSVAELLIERGLCKAQNILCARYYYAIDPMSGGFEFLIYDLSDPILLEEIRNIVLQKFNSDPQMTHLIITAYAGDNKPPYPGEAPETKTIIYRQEYRK